MGDSEIQKILSAVGDYGLSPCSAVVRAMGFERTRDYAEAIGRRRVEVGMCLNGHHSRIYSDIRDDVASRLGLTRERVDTLIVELRALWGRA